jgi:hypothetical protein
MALHFRSPQTHSFQWFAPDTQVASVEDQLEFRLAAGELCNSLQTAKRREAKLQSPDSSLSNERAAAEGSTTSRNIHRAEVGKNGFAHFEFKNVTASQTSGGSCRMNSRQRCIRTSDGPSAPRIAITVSKSSIASAQRRARNFARPAS